MKTFIQNTKYKIRYTKILGAIIAFVVIGILILKLSNNVSAAWYDDNFAYRQKIAVTNSSGSIQTDFQVMLTVDTQTLITAGKMQSDCDDIKTIDPSGKVLPYWLEPSTCNTTTTKIWTKIPTIPTSASYIYLYYGNPSATTASSPTKTFIREISDVQGAWDLDEAGTGTRADSSGNGNTLANTNGVTNATGQFSNASQFTASSTQRLSITDNASLSSGNIDFTLSSWVYLDSTASNRDLMGKWSAAQSEYILWYISGTGFRFSAYNDATTPKQKDVTATTFGNASAGTWYYIVGWHNRNSGEVGISVNGIVNTSAWSNGVQDGTANFQIGYNSATNYMDGRVDNVRFYKRALSANERADLYGAGGDRQGYVTTNYPNKELVRKYNTSVSAGSPSTEEKAPQPVAYWKFDEGTGQTTKDSTTNGNSGTLGANSSSASDDPTWQTEDMCVSGKCLKFDGTNDYVTTSAPVYTQTQNITLSAWVKLNASTANAPVIYNGNNGANGYGIWIGNGSGGSGNKITVYVGGQSFDAVTSTTTLSANTWTHITATRGTGAWSLYVNGVLKHSGSATPSTPGTRTSIGGTASVSLPGFIDEAKIYPYARTAAQIKADYNSRGSIKGSATTYNLQPTTLSNGLLGYWKMDEASWNGTTGEVIDASGNASNGTAACTGASCTKATTGAGKFGNAGSFGGSSEGPNVNIPVQMIDGSNPTFSYSLWVKATNTGNTTQDILAQARGGTNNNSSYEIKYAIGTKNIGITDGGGSTINNYSYDLSSWTHLTVTNDYLNNVYRLYINGSLVKTGTAATLPVQALSAQFKIGNHPYYPYGLAFSGSIDEVRVYNRVLSGLEAQQLANFAPGPVARYNFEEGSGSTVNDTSGNGNTGTWSGTGSRWTSGKIGKAGKFNGSDDKVTVTDSSNILSAKTGDHTISLWLQTSITSNAQVYNTSCGGCGAEYIWVLANGKVRYNVKDTSNNEIAAGSFDSTTTVNDNKWHHIETIWDTVNNIAYIYIDGRQDASTTSGASSIGSITTNTSKYIGTTGTTNYFPGQIDDVRIYNYARTQKQIIADMSEGGTSISTGVQGTQTGRPATPVGYWKFDEGTGTIANNNGSCGGTCNGTLTSMASPATSTSGWTQSGKFGKALVFDGTNDYVTTGTPPTNITTAAQGSASIWFSRTDSGSSKPLISINQNNSNNNIFRLTFSGSTTLQVMLKTTTDIYRASVDIGSKATDGSWNHIVFISGVEGNALYVNGIKQTLTYTTGTAITTGWISSLSSIDRLTIGNSLLAVPEYFNGKLDEVKVYNYALSSEEVKQEYNRGSAQVIGAVSTASNGTTPSNGDDRRYCVPGDISTCSAPTSEWNFEEGTGTTLKDTSGNALNGTLGGTGTQRWTSGKIGKGGKFNGTDDYVTAGSGSSLLLTQLTISGWVKTGTVSKGILGKYDNHNYWRFRYYLNSSGQVVFNLGKDVTWTTNATSTTVITDNKWHYISGTYDTVNMRLYIDGKLEATVAESRTLNSIGDSSGICIGTDRFDCVTILGNGFFNGSIDNVRIFNYARTPAQIAWDYNQGDPIAHYKFDECQGNVAGDSSGGGNNGTVTIGASGTQTTVGNCTDGSSASARYNGASGKRNYSMNFDGTDDYLRVTGLDSATPDTVQTMSVWIKPAASQTAGIVGRMTDNMSSFKTTYGFGLQQDGTNIYALASNNNSEWYNNLSASITLNQWNHVVFTITGSGASQTGKLYINGKEVDTYTGNSSYYGSYFFSIGSGYRLAANSYFNGQIDDVKIFNYALTPLQVKTLMNDGAYRSGPSTGSP